MTSQSTFTGNKISTDLRSEIRSLIDAMPMVIFARAVAATWQRRVVRTDARTRSASAT